jgi:hypothetical protein
MKYNSFKLRYYKFYSKTKLFRFKVTYGKHCNFTIYFACILMSIKYLYKVIFIGASGVRLSSFADIFCASFCSEAEKTLPGNCPNF